MTLFQRFGPRFGAAAALLLVLALSPHPSSAQSAGSDTGVAAWPELNLYVPLHDGFRLVGTLGSKRGEDSAAQQVYTGAQLGYQFKLLTREHLPILDPDKDHLLVVSAGYEYLDNFDSATPSTENRFVLTATPGVRPWSNVLLRDRNRIELRWINGQYSTRYRNRLDLEFDLRLHKLRVDPYLAAEFFYNSNYSSWNQEQYTAGLGFPLFHRLLLQTYYLRQHCTTCSPNNFNVGGITITYFIGGHH